MVGTYGSFPLETEVLESIINASVEPDLINRQRITEDFINALTIPIEWLLDHGIYAKELAINFIYEACEAKKNDNRSWSRSLGWVFHYITDWGTPHHSPNSRSTPVITSTKIGVKTGAITGGIGGFIKGITRPNTNFWEIILDILTGGGIGAGIGAGTGAGVGVIGLAFGHNNFENRCDELWEENIQLINENFRTMVRYQQLPEQLNLALNLFEEKMNSFRQLCENLSENWIDTCGGVEYANYMVEIALVMNLACQIVIRNN
ncbi:MAG: hypothetical protein ACTSRI_13680 [Promethearchaeota archaeon]